MVKRSSLFIIIWGFILPIFSQTVFKEIPEFPFINTSINNFSFPKDSNAFEGLFGKLDQIIFQGKGHINIIHIGGSHIQADIVSNQIRKNLLSFHPGIIASRGIIFPYSAASTNNPYNYKTSFKGKWIPIRNIHREIISPLGLTGIAISSSDSSAEIQIKIRNNDIDPYFDFSRIRVIGNSENNSIEPILKIDSIFYLNGVFDSTTTSYLFNLTNYTDSLTLKFQSNDSIHNPFVLSGIILENDFPGITYSSIGVNGASVPSYLKCVNFERDLNLIKPDLIIFSIGINDAAGDNFDPNQFKNNYNRLIEKIKKVSPDCAIIFTTNNDSYKRSRRKYFVNKNGLIAQKAFFELAYQNNAAVWDFFSIMGGLKSMSEWEKAGLANRDKVHFKAEGYKIMGDLFFNAFILEYLKHLSKNN